MPDSVEIAVEKVLKGLALDFDDDEICDFTLEEQISVMESQGVAPTVNPNYKPIVGETITYIVATVILNDADEILMMQEAKQSCAGKWYLPAGRMEKNESIIEAAKREVREETGLLIDCTTLLLVECAGGSWIRFVLTGIVIDGTLKTPSQADKESLQAKWIANLDEVTLRAKDIKHLIDRAKQYKQARSLKDKTWHKDQLPLLKPHTKLLLRLLVVTKKRSSNRLHVLLSERTTFHLPTCEVHPAKSIYSTLRRFMIEIFGAEVAPHRPHGLLNVEHGGKEGADGACLSLLVVFKSPLEEAPIIGKCVWHEVTKDLEEKILLRIMAKNSTLPVHVIR
ncbi:8-oxo-dGDP phosphatase NUDT18 [Agrilus planipennis]|uniref:8-oxo-dGDP phosphatase NUDT18 n=1 Tax=Agrilus planipennis TaxID=224129 RepID=A0A1W4WWP6_AGRPL|nr:8-oxo-dGDP phosphatase NUDT18 [Agrilus planipennis]XP_018328283.1 8-oxo-dGDP phosphatase NUDT18 [Agrilus planipennis]XP_018328284.1 8-oxo-dGDP phosphatase NUDT18 [Agrilus planipennis]